MNETAEEPTRRIRPWLAGLLTLFGWGLGLFYARRTRLAIWLAVLTPLFALAVAAAIFAYAVQTHTSPVELFDGVEWTLVDVANLVITGVLAVLVWILAAQRKVVPQGGPARMLGYIAIFILPIIFSLLLAMCVRFALIQPFRTPSGSMQPTLQVGGYVGVTKFSYGYSRYSFVPFETLGGPGRAYAHLPERGDIVVFRPVAQPEHDFVKRIIGLPGDRIQVIAGVLHINGAVVPREAAPAARVTDPYGADVQEVPAFRETLPNGVSYLTLDRGDTELDNTRVYEVPAGHYFMMGDDRDNSADSRVVGLVGFVPFDNIIGRVDYVLPPP